MEQSDWRKRYHVLWFLKLNRYTIDFTDNEIEQLPENVVDLILGEFLRFVHTENTLSDRGKIIHLKDIHQKMDLLVPHWVMDRLKESMQLYVEGMYFAVIMLCGSIVEFIEDGLFVTYKDKLQSGEREPSKSVKRNLEKLNKYKILHDEDCRLLCDVRGLRDNHTHLKVLREDPIKLRSDALDSILKLLTFFNEQNMTSKYQDYLKYLFEYSRS